MWTEKSKDHYRLCAYYIDPLTGQRHKIGVTFHKNTPQARNKAESKLNELIARKTSYTPEHITLKRLVDLYIQYQGNVVKQSTVNRNASICRQFIMMLGADADVNKLTAGIVKDRFMARTTNPTTLNEYISRFKALMRWGYQNDFVNNIEWINKLIKLEDKTQKEKLEDKFLEREECERLLNAMDHEDWRNLTAFLILSGCRIGECLALDESDFDFTARTISINKTLALHSNYVGTPKTLTSIRTVDMNDQLYALSRSLLAQNRKKRKMLYLDRTPVYFKPTGEYASYDAYRMYLERTSVRVLGRQITPHVLRHTYASLMAEAGVQYETIARQLGHSNSRITKLIYIHITKRIKERENEMIRKIALL